MGKELAKMLVGMVFAGLCCGVTVRQEPFKIVQAGIQTSINCEHDDSSFLTILWYRQESNSMQKQLQLVGYSVEGNDPNMEMTNYTIKRPDVKHASLTTPPGQAGDSAVYFCATSKGTARAPCLTAAHELRWTPPILS
uniref:Immunoglobulin V-set domain-containing protein n=1 Tax=Varanus komodoensis TaxID=61221 RepID=A0A8D2KUP8_VARKO